MLIPNKTKAKVANNGNVNFVLERNCNLSSKIPISKLTKPKIKIIIISEFNSEKYIAIRKKETPTDKLPSKGIEESLIRVSLGLLRMPLLKDNLIAIGVKTKLIRNENKIIFKCN